MGTAHHVPRSRKLAAGFRRVADFSARFRAAEEREVAETMVFCRRERIMFGSDTLAALELRQRETGPHLHPRQVADGRPSAARFLHRTGALS